MKKILILFAHPSYERSTINRAMINAVEGLSGVTVHDLYEHYPSFNINVAREQQLAEQHDVIIFQHPFFWYSTPALLKEWQDLVLTEQWAYDFKATGLKGKSFMIATTCGGPAEAYGKGGYNHFTMPELLRPIEQMAYLCKMTYLDPYVVFGTGKLNKEQLAQTAEHYRQHLMSLQSASEA